MLELTSAPTEPWQRETCDTVLESARQVSGSEYGKHLADRISNLPVTPERCDYLRMAPRMNAHVPLQLWFPDIWDVVLISTSVDWSEGGLSLHCPFPLDTGTTFYVCSADTGDEAAWVPLEVRHCQPDDRGWTVGSRFASADTVMP